MANAWHRQLRGKRMTIAGPLRGNVGMATAAWQLAGLVAKTRRRCLDALATAWRIQTHGNCMAKIIGASTPVLPSKAFDSDLGCPLCRQEARSNLDRSAVPETTNADFDAV